LLICSTFNFSVNSGIISKHLPYSVYARQNAYGRVMFSPMASGRAGLRLINWRLGGRAVGSRPIKSPPPCQTFLSDPHQSEFKCLFFLKMKCYNQKLNYFLQELLDLAITRCNKTKTKHPKPHVLCLRLVAGVNIQNQHFNSMDYKFIESFISKSMP